MFAISFTIVISWPIVCSSRIMSSSIVTRKSYRNLKCGITRSRHSKNSEFFEKQESYAVIWRTMIRHEIKQCDSRSDVHHWKISTLLLFEVPHHHFPTVWCLARFNSNQVMVTMMKGLHEELGLPRRRRYLRIKEDVPMLIWRGISLVVD